LQSSVVVLVQQCSSGGSGSDYMDGVRFQ
jgi:hypothetical protein